MNGMIALIAHDGTKDEMLGAGRGVPRAARGGDRRRDGDHGRRPARELELERALRALRAARRRSADRLDGGRRLRQARVFLRDPLTAHPHDPDIQALMKVCDVQRVPLATNVATARLCLAALAPVY